MNRTAFSNAVPTERASNAYQPVSQNYLELHPQTSHLASFNDARVVKRKPLPGVFAAPGHEAHNHDISGHEPSQHGVWTPGFWARLPVLAVLSLFGILACWTPPCARQYDEHTLTSTQVRQQLQ